MTHGFDTYLLMDSGTHTSSPIEPLAMDEALANGMTVPGAQPILHFWIYDRALFLGRRDAKLPRLEQALKKMASVYGYGAVLRAAGGACVPLDEGILNLALLLPDTRISIDDLYRLGASLLNEGLQRYGDITFGEVSGSYCAGDYDFSLKGKKIGGMAQRRTRFGSILEVCIHVEGSGLARGHMMEDFYREAGLEEMEQGKPIPSIDGTTIGSLAELTGQDVTVSDVKERMVHELAKLLPLKQVPFSLPLDSVEQACHHLTAKLGLFSYRAADIQAPEWRLP